MADVKWIKITTDIFDDEKILLIESMPASDSIITIWFKLLTLAGKQNNSGVFMMNDKIAYTDEMLATIFRRDINTVRLALKTFEEFGMIQMVDNVITIPNWGKHQNLDSIEKKRNYQREYMREYRKKQELLAENKICKTNANNLRESNVSRIEREIELDKDKEINNISCATGLHDSEPLDDFFESIWKLYPIKKGKGSVSKTKKKVLQRIGYDEIKRCVERFVKDMKSEERDKKYWMHGSTFFNSGYVDYLDENYIPQKAAKSNDRAMLEETEEEEVLDGTEWTDWSKVTNDQNKAI